MTYLAAYLFGVLFGAVALAAARGRYAIPVPVKPSQEALGLSDQEAWMVAWCAFELLGKGGAFAVEDGPDLDAARMVWLMGQSKEEDDGDE